jgi:poly(A) polymerase
VVLYAAYSPAQVVSPISKSSSSNRTEPRVIAESDHQIPRAEISRNALKVVQTLNDAGHESYMVGGCVRDLLLSRKPKDFDIATAAEPETVRQLFRNSRVIGRRFRLVHVRFGREIVEVATFRASHSSEDDDGAVNVNGRIVRDNVYGTLEDDAWRRDFSVNSLYYDARDNSIVDHVGGMEDMEARRLRLLGCPSTRYREDPVRLLRAMRFAAKLNFEIDEASEAPIQELAPLLGEVPGARLFEECLKLFLGGDAERSFEMLTRYHIFEELFPETARYLEVPKAERFVRQAFVNTDLRIAEGKPVTPGYLFAALLWEPMSRLTEENRQNGMPDFQAIEVAASDAISTQNERIAFPRRFSLMAKDIWNLQPRLEQRKGKRAGLLLERPRFRAAYDFLALRCQAGEEELEELVDWWTKLQEANPVDRESALKQLPPQGSRRRNRRRRKTAEA